MVASKIAGTEDEIFVSVVEASPEEGLRALVYGDAMGDECTYMESIRNIGEFVAYQKEYRERLAEEEGGPAGPLFSSLAFI